MLRFRSRFLVFPTLSCLISHAFFPGSRTRHSVCFLSPFPDSLPQLFLRCLPFAFAFGLSPFDPLSFVRFSSGSGYSAFVSSVPFFLIPPHNCFLSATAFSFDPSAFRSHIHPVSRVSVPASGTWHSVCFLSSYPVSLPQLFHWCFPHAFAFGLFPFFPLSFVRFFPVPTTQLLRFLFPSSRFSLAVVLSGANLSAFRLWYSAFCSSFHLLTSRLAAATSFAPAFLSVSAVPLSYYLRFRLFGLGNVP